MKLVVIAAVGRNLELGLDKDMPWKRALKQDLAFFKKQTSGRPMVMGRRTFESLPGLLPGRKHLVITRSDLKEQPNLKLYSSVEAFLQDWKKEEGIVWCIGGGRVYSELLEQADALLLTEIDQTFEADTWFPAFDKTLYTRKVLDACTENGLSWKHVLYLKKGKEAWFSKELSLIDIQSAPDLLAA